ncbi:zinc-binding dehydrogenase [Gordonia sp. NPDC003424]
MSADDEPDAPPPPGDELLAIAANLSHFHREHEKYYSEAPLTDALALQRIARTLTALAERWSSAEPTGAPSRLGVLAVKEGPAHFTPIADLCLAGEITTHIDRTYPLDETAAALAYVGAGQALGKVVVTP